MTHMLWTTNVINNPEEKESFETYLQNNQRLLKRLNEIIEDKENAIDRSETQISSYDNPAWIYKQAHINGRKAALAEIKQLTQ